MAAPTSTTYTPEERDAIVTAVCVRVMAGDRLRVATRLAGVSLDAFYGWLADSAELAARYARARLVSASTWEDKASEYAENARPETAQVARLQEDNARWRARVANPRAYGDKLDLTSKDEKLAGVVILPAKEKQEPID